MDVARRVGVSKGAVSLVFNGRPGISRETAERIRSAAAELGWVPHLGARTLSQARALTIGIVIQRPAQLIGMDPFYPALIAGIEQVLATTEYALMLRVVNDDAEAARSYERLAVQGRVDGFVLTDMRRRDPRLRLISELSTPAVALGPVARSCPFPVVGPDDRSTTLRLVRHLVELGHRRIAHVSGPAAYEHSQARRKGWRDALAGAGLEPGPEVEGDFTAAGGEFSTRLLLDRPEPPTAIFYANDLMAIAGMAVAASRGLCVPEHLSIAGYDQISLSAHTAPPLATVSRDNQLWGRLAARMLIDRIEGRAVPHRTVLESEVIIRGSIGRPPPERMSTGDEG